MIQIAFLTFILFIQDETPFKAKEDFEIKFDLSFKQRPPSDDIKTVRFDETQSEHDKRTDTTPLPYLKLFIKILTTQPNEVKLIVIKDDQSTILRKKVEGGMEFKLELGFTDDITDRVSGYKHVIQFHSSDKKVISKIVIEFDEEGYYFVNGEKRGKV